MEGRCEEGYPSVLPPVLCRREGGREGGSSYWARYTLPVNMLGLLSLSLARLSLSLVNISFC